MADNVNVRTLELKHDVRKFTDEAKNQTLNYDVFFVDCAGLEIRLRPVDATSKQILLNYFNQK